MDKLVVHRAQGTYQAFLKKLASTELLIWDDFGIKPIPDTVTSDIYDILDERERSGQAALIITTQLPIENWSEVITDPVRCEAITDRIVSKSQIISLKGESYRKRLKKLDSN
jgi:DNA replication protein DnaC